MLVLTEECGMLGTIPWQLYPVLSDPANLAVFRDPLAHKAEVERLLGRPIRVYIAGEHYPILSYTLLSNSDDNTTVGPSGFFKLPTPSFVFQPTKRGDKRFELPASASARAFEGSLIKPHRKEHVTQAHLFAEHPGVHYSLLCRALNEEGRIGTLLEQAFPDADVFTVENMDTFQAMSHWLSALDRTHLKKIQQSAVAEIEAIVSAVHEKRRRSGSPLGSTGLLVSLLSLRPHPSPAALHAALSATPDVNKGENRHGYTPLMMAALHGHGDAVHELLRRGADPNKVDLDGSNALMFACTNGDLRICETLLALTDVTQTSVDGTNALHIACTKKNLAPLIGRLLAAGPNTPDDDGDTPLHLAAGWGLLDHIRILLAAGANPNIPNAEGEIPLACAINDKQEGAARLLLPVSDLRTRGLIGRAIKAKQDDIAVALLEGGQPVVSWTRVLELATERKMPRLAALAKRYRGLNEI